jgi:hypothetical protein
LTGTRFIAIMLGRLKMGVDEAIGLYCTFLNRFLSRSECSVVKDLCDKEESERRELDSALDEIIRKGGWAIDTTALGEVSVAGCNG